MSLNSKKVLKNLELKYHKQQSSKQLTAFSNLYLYLRANIWQFDRKNPIFDNELIYSLQGILCL